MTSCFKPYYEGGPITITIDKSLLFYMELKKKDPWNSAYAIYVEVVNLSNHNPVQMVQELQHANSTVCPQMEAS